MIAIAIGDYLIFDQVAWYLALIHSVGIALLTLAMSAAWFYLLSLAEDRERTDRYNHFIAKCLTGLGALFVIVHVRSLIGTQAYGGFYLWVTVPLYLSVALLITLSFAKTTAIYISERLSTLSEITENLDQSTSRVFLENQVGLRELAVQAITIKNRIIASQSPGLRSADDYVRLSRLLDKFIDLTEEDLPRPYYNLSSGAGQVAAVKFRHLAENLRESSGGLATFTHESAIDCIEKVKDIVKASEAGIIQSDFAILDSKRVNLSSTRPASKQVNRTMIRFWWKKELVLLGKGLAPVFLVWASQHYLKIFNEDLYKSVFGLLGLWALICVIKVVEPDLLEHLTKSVALPTKESPNAPALDTNLPLEEQAKLREQQQARA